MEEEAVEEVAEEEVKGHSRQPGGQHPGDMSTGGRRRGRLPLSLSLALSPTQVARIRIRSAWPRDPEPSLDTRSPFPSPDVTYVQHFASSFPF